MVHCDHFEQWREKARSLLMRQIEPDAIIWQNDKQPGLFAEQNAPTAAPQASPGLRVPAEFVQQAQIAACYRDDQKWALLYRLAWRLAFEHKSLLNVRSDADVRHLQHMLRAVSRDRHKMKAFVRFQEMPIAETDPQRQKNACFSAWYEPQHLIVESMAPFFAKRFTGMNWSILTPERCAHWYGGLLSFSPGVDKPAARTDALEQLWLAYYRSTFNPARVKIKAMQAEMPKRYWRNLPEAQLIAPLIRGASGRVQTMLSKPATDPDILRSKSKAIRAQQDALRSRETAEESASSRSRPLS